MNFGGLGRARLAQAMFPYFMDLVHHSVWVTQAEHPSESLEPGEVYRSSLDAPLSEMGDGLQWGRFSKAKPHFRTAEALQRLCGTDIEKDGSGGVALGLGWNMLEHDPNFDCSHQGS